MKIKSINALPPLLILMLTGCPALDSDIPSPELEIYMNQEFRIHHNYTLDGSADTFETHKVEVRVLDIDPGPEGRTNVFTEDPVLGMTVPANFSVTSGTIRVERDNDEFAITGDPGGMGIVTFTNKNETKSAKLYVFVRNWKKADVFRHILDPDPVNYRFRKGNPTASVPPLPIGTFGAFSDSDKIDNATGTYYWRDDQWAVYKSIVDRGFHYESPSGNSNRAGLVHGDRSNPNWFRGLHTEPHIVYYPQGVYPYFDNMDTWKESFLGKPVFEFVLHLEYDGDMVGGFPDRQRLELKTMDNTIPPGRVRHRTEDNSGWDSRDLMYSLGGGETFTHRWKFKLPKDFIVSTEYTHIHQLKPEGADNSQPTITLTARRTNSGSDILQLSYRGPIRDMIGDREIPSVNWFPQEIPLDLLRGEWVRAEETVTYDNPGAYRIKLVRIRDLRVLMEFEFNPVTYAQLNLDDPFVMFRKGNTYIRKKTGFYRRIMHVGPFGVPNPEDMIQLYKYEGDEAAIYFADLEMDKWKN